MKRRLRGFTLIKLLVVMIIFCFVTGCASVMPGIVKFDDQNAANTVAAAKQIMKHWEMNSAAVKETLGSAIKDKLPASFGDSIGALDLFAQTYAKDQSTMKEADAGRIVVLAGKLIEPMVQTIINQYAPDLWSRILKYLPAFLAI